MYARRVTRPKPLKAALKAWGAPIGGWVSNRALANPSELGVKQGAAILDNFVPRASSVLLRRGKARFAELDNDPQALFSYKDGLIDRLFASTTTNIFDISDGTPVSVLNGKSNGAWNVVQFATSGDVFLIGVNGADAGFLYDGDSFTVPSITFASGITTADMAFVWIYKNRLWFAQKDSMDAWYLPVDSIGGIATRFPLAGIFGKGGLLLFGQTWSLDNGQAGGLSEQAIFCSSEGEVAIYQGADPSSASDWQKVGVYRIGTPLGRNAFFRGGGDLAIATTVGLVPLSKAVSLDVTALNVATLSYNITDAWSDAIYLRGMGGWLCELWPEQKLVFISPPDIIGASNPVSFVANAETGAWCRFTGWRMVCTEVFRGVLYFGSPGGLVFSANSTGSDDDMPYTGVALPLFEDMGSPASLKIGKLGRTVFRALGPTQEVTSLHVDFDTNLGPVPDASGGSSGNLWGTGKWGQSSWGSRLPEFLSQDWQSVSGAGYALSLAVQITSGGIAPLDAELIRHELTYDTATVVT